MHAQRAKLPDERWHFQHGPIDLVIAADGERAAVSAAHEACWQRFENILSELVGELARLRLRIPPTLPLTPQSAECPLGGPIARRMWHACAPYRRGYITPMAAVAGSVADELIACYRRPGVTRAYVNNGGDIALHLSPGAEYAIGVFADLSRLGGEAARGALQRNNPALDASLLVHAWTPVRGVATSGWRGRSFSLGIADSVTILAVDGASADAAATIVANAVDVDHAGIVRRPANSLKDDTDLGALAVTTDVPPLPTELIDLALERGARVADELVATGRIVAAALFLQGRVRTVGALPSRVARLAPPDDTDKQTHKQAEHRAHNPAPDDSNASGAPNHYEDFHV
jgi:ApbE superfamily uncharacterized protein (UPF0280 family)